MLGSPDRSAADPSGSGRAPPPTWPHRPAPLVLDQGRRHRHGSVTSFVPSGGWAPTSWTAPAR